MLRLSLWLALALSVAVLATGCGSGQNDAAPAASASSQDAGPEHIHGLGVLDGTLYIATHTGLWSAPADETRAQRVSETQQDVMGFSIVDRHRFLGSGHPDPNDADLPSSLGLIASEDHGRNWQGVALSGQVDFHVLESSGTRIYGVDSASSMLLSSSDSGRRWRQRTPPAAIISLAIDPDDSARIVVSTEAGIYASRDGGAHWQRLRDDLAGLLAWPARDALYLVDGRGTVQLSADRGRRWKTVGSAGGQPTAFITDGRQQLYVALAQNTVQRSSDGGRTWTLRAAG